MIKKLIWLIKNKDKLEELTKQLEKPKKKEDTKTYSIAGVPDFQKNM
jgi:hypothetical protein